MATHSILYHGAKGDGVTDDAAAIQAAVDACVRDGGGRVLVPGGGTYLAGPFKLGSHVELHLEHGSTIAASTSREDYTEPALLGEGDDGAKWISAEGATFVSVTGGGVIDGRGVEFMTEELPHIYRTVPGRPFVIDFENCSHVTFKGITLRDSPFWAMHLAGCDDVLIDGIRILNNLKVPNSDGIDPDCCRNVRIVNCHIEAGDDCICLKAEAKYAHYGPCENIVVTGCTLVSTSCALKIGTGTHSDFRNIVFDSCTINRSHRGIGIFLRDGGTVENVLFSNMAVETRYFDAAWWGDATPIYVTAFKRREGSEIGAIRNVRFSNITCRGENGAYIAGCPESMPEAIALDNVSVELTKWSKHPGGRYDRRPCSVEGIIEHPSSGFHVENARDVTVRNCAVRWGPDPPPYYRHALWARNAPGLSVENLKGESAFPERYRAVETG